MDLVARIQRHFAAHVQITRESLEALPAAIARAAGLVYQALLAQQKLLICGNGGSAADAQHFSAELVNRFEIDRPGLAAVALTTDGSALTSIANDDQFEQIFAKQVRALGQPGDILVAITTSGRSDNIVHAVDAAHEHDMPVVLLSGRDGGPAASVLGADDIEIRVPGASTARIQEMHILIIHCLCDLIDQQLLGSEGEPR